jgi:cyclic beta-1,2-glucan synthetase
VRTSFERLVTSGESTARLDVLLATQCDANAGFGGSTAFVAMRHDAANGSALEDWTCDRRELFDSGGRRVIPDVLGKRAGAGLDPCAAAATMFGLEAGGTRECVFILGHGNTVADARALARTAIASSAFEREQLSGAQWDALLRTVTVQTPDPLFDVLVNRWLLYQVLACRVWGRAGFYQAGGAFGFRDQLQDTMALAVAAPQLLRQQLLLSASRQFVEGDVQHWWHPPGGAGVRTRFSDDLLWLPYAAVHYVDVTGDIGILDETAPFLEGEQIPDGAEDAYFVPRVSELSATLYEHCARTLDRSLAVGAHGLPLMGSGDWNDGLNRVGYPGRGESVWLGWFLCVLVGTFGPIARRRNDIERADRWETAAHGWRDALRSNAWDGEWFVRAFFDDGTPLGSRTSRECRIDLVAQSWAVLSDVATPEQQQSSMAATARLLIDETNGLVRILDPPLTRAKPDPGYIGAYPPGVRENGGQYSHAGVWTLMAQAALGDADAAYLTFTRLSPAHRSAHPQQGPRYQLEPYAMAGDVYTHPPYTGRGGWSWYTGSAAWMHRAAIESICGLRVRAGRISLAPRLPSHWPRIQMTLHRNGRVHELIVCAAWAKADIERALANGAVRIGEEEWLELAEAGDASRHLIVTRAVAHAADAASQIE